MAINHDTQQKINQFAREQSELYLSAAEMTYIEKLRRKAGRTYDKMNSKLARFKNTSDKSREAQDDMILYMNDYMDDLIANGMNEQEAFDKAKAELAFSGRSEQSADLHERFKQYYALRDPADEEIIGLFFGGFLFLGIATGGLIGFLISGGVPMFLQNGWIYTLVGIGSGAVIGMGLGQIANAIVTIRKRKESR